MEVPNTVITLVGLATVLSIAKDALTVSKSLKGRSDDKVAKLEERSDSHANDIYATKKDLRENDARSDERVAKLRLEMDLSSGRLHDRIDELDKKLERKIDPLLGAVGELRGILVPHHSKS